MTKRSNREGTICRRSDGRWTAAITLDGGKRQYFYATTQRAVQAKLLSARRAISNGLPVSSDRQKLGQYLERWLGEVAEPTGCVKVARHAGYLRIDALNPNGDRGLTQTRCHGNVSRP